MSSSTIESKAPLATEVKVTHDTITVELTDGRTISAPTAWYPRLAHGSSSERSNWRLLGGGYGIHWPMLDEDISVSNLLVGQPSSESQSSLSKWLKERNKPKSSRKRVKS